MIQRAQDWFSEANRTYQETVVRDLSQDQEAPVAASEAGQEIAAENSAKEADVPQAIEAVPTVADNESPSEEFTKAEAERSKQEVEPKRLRPEEAEREAVLARQKQLGEILTRREAEFAQADKERCVREAEQQRVRLEKQERKAEAERRKRIAEQERLGEEEAARRKRLAYEQAKREEERLITGRRHAQKKSGKPNLIVSGRPVSKNRVARSNSGERRKALRNSAGRP